MINKKCKVCKDTQPISNFYFRKETNKFRDSCRKCFLSKCESYRNKNRDTRNAKQRTRYTRDPQRMKDQRRWAYFRISKEEYSWMLEIQDNKCAICRQPETSYYKGTLKMLAIDHCHKTGYIRQLLCSKCNWALGHFKDDIELLKVAINYIEAHRRVA